MPETGAILSVMSRLMRAVRLVLRDGRIPKPLRWLAGFAVLPIPGPVDELVLLVVGAWLFAFRRKELRSAWRLADARPGAASDR
jgi:hypothetical protein